MDHPVRRTLLGDLAGPDAIGRAMGLDSSTASATRAMGPLLGGVLFDALGMAGAYFLGAVLFGTGALLIASVAYRPPRPAARDAALLANIREGLRYVRSNRVILGTLAVTLFMNFWGFAYAGMVPVIGKEQLGLDASAIGLLMSAEGLGAFAAALAIAWRVRPQHYTRLYFWGSALFLLAALLFTQAGGFAPALAALLAAGLGFAGFAAMQSTIVLAAAPPALRSRAMGVVSVCIGGGGPLGILHVGLLADWLGAPGAVALSAIEGLIALALAAWLWPELLRPFAPSGRTEISGPERPAGDASVTQGNDPRGGRSDRRAARLPVAFRPGSRRRRGSPWRRRGG
jgi:predicted MFS family arabinose efflux permease